jgi:hypothetical protein
MKICHCVEQNPYSSIVFAAEALGHEYFYLKPFPARLRQDNPFVQEIMVFQEPS